MSVAVLLGSLHSYDITLGSVMAIVVICHDGYNLTIAVVDTTTDILVNTCS